MNQLHVRTMARGNQRHQRGRSLIEIMVAMVIGLIILTAVLLTTSSSSFNGFRSNSQSRLTEDGQIALNILVPQLRMAGYSTVVTNGNSPSNSQRFAGPAVRGCDNGFVDPAAAQWNAANGDESTYSTRVNCNGGAGAPGIAILYEADGLNTRLVNGNPTDCLGNQLTRVTSNLAAFQTGDTAFVADNRYYLRENDETGLFTLMCDGNSQNTPAQPLVDNIEQMRITYGVNRRTDITDASGRVLPGNEAQAYLTASEIDGDASFNGDAYDRWRRVNSVQICIVLRSLEPLRDGEAGAVVDCDGETQDDGFLRKVVRTTVALRNRI